jgi:hypothetical protein
MSCGGGHLGFPIGITNWMVLYNLKVFWSDMKFKMAATAGLSLTLDPMGKMFQNTSSLKPLGQLKPNCPESPMLIYVLRWRPSWISDWHKKQKLGKGHSNDHSFTVWVQSVHYFQRRRSLKFLIGITFI